MGIDIAIEASASSLNTHLPILTYLFAMGCPVNGGIAVYGVQVV
jgi:hypothetical protein